MVLVVLVDSFCTCRDIDARAGGRQPPDVIKVLANTCLALYGLEMIVLCHLHSGSLCVVVVVVVVAVAVAVTVAAAAAAAVDVDVDVCCFLCSRPS